MRRVTDVAAIDVDGARYCLQCAPMSAEAAEDQGIGGVVFLGDIELDEACNECGQVIE